MTTILASAPFGLTPPALRWLAGTHDATFNYNPQDATVMSSATVVIHDLVDGPAPTTAKIKLNTPLSPSAPGQYIYKEGESEVGAQSFASAAHTLEVFGAVLGQPINWAFSNPQLGINYDWGTDFNAFYSRKRQALNFCDKMVPQTGKQVYAADSGELVSHEMGHAILDALRPAYLDSHSPEVAAFHESFGDMMSICMSLNNPRVLEQVSQSTGGDLSKPNIVAAIGEELGTAINTTNQTDVTGGNFVRNALNKFTYQDPNTLADGTSPDNLTSEPHSFSRLWTGAFYDVITAIQAENLKKAPPLQALQATGAEALRLLAEMVKAAPHGEFLFKDMARSWIASDSKRGALIEKVMTARQILGSPASPSAPARYRLDPTLPEGPWTLTPQGPRPLSSVTRGLEVRLGCEAPEPYRGATFTARLDKGTDPETSASHLQRSVLNQIAQQRVLVTRPGQQLSERDYYDRNGRLYSSMLVYHNDGSKTLERVPVLE